MSENTDSTKLKVTMVGAVVIIVIIAMFSFIMINRQGSGALTIKIGDNEATMEIAENKDNFIALMEELMKEENKKITLAILKDKYGLFKKDSLELIDQIRRRPGEDDFSIELRGLLFNLRGPFKREYHKYYNIEIREVVEAINKLDYEDVVPKELRELSDKGEGIFRPLPIDVHVMCSNSYNILNGKALVIRGKGGDFSGRQWLLFNKDNPDPFLAPLSVLVIDEFPDINQGKKPCIIINPNDAKIFFGENFASGRKYDAVLFPTKKGYRFFPSEKPQPVVDASTKESSKKLASVQRHIVTD